MKNISINGLTFPVPDFFVEVDKRKWDEHLLYDVCETIVLLNILNGALKNRLAADLKKKLKQNADRLNEDTTSKIGCKNRDLVDMANKGIEILNEIYKAGKTKNPVSKNAIRQSAVNTVRLFLTEAAHAYKAIIEIIGTGNSYHAANLANQLQVIYSLVQNYSKSVLEIYNNKEYKKDRVAPIKEHMRALNEAFTKYELNSNFLLCVNVYAKTILSVEAVKADALLGTIEESLNILKQAPAPVAPPQPTTNDNSKQEKTSTTGKPINKMLPGNFGVFEHTAALTEEFKAKIEVRKERSATVSQPNVNVPATLTAHNTDVKKEQPPRNRSNSFAPDSPLMTAKKKQAKKEVVKQELANLADLNELADDIIKDSDGLNKPRSVIN